MNRKRKGYIMHDKACNNYSTTLWNEAPIPLYTRVLVAFVLHMTLFMFILISPAYAVVNCFDYVRARLERNTDVHPPPPGKSYVLDRIESFSCVGKPEQRAIFSKHTSAPQHELTPGNVIRGLISSSYNMKNWKKGDPLPTLIHKDIILTPIGHGNHGGFVNTSGSIDHYLQIPTAMYAYIPLSELNRFPYPLCQEIIQTTTTTFFGFNVPSEVGRTCSCGGLSLNDDLAMFISKAKVSAVEVWYHPRKVIINNRTPLGGDVVPASPISARYDSEVPMTLKAKPGYEIDGSPTGCGISKISDDNYKTGPVKIDCTVDVNFKIKQYSVSGYVSPVVAGNIKPAKSIVKHGSTERFEVKANKGWLIKSSDNGCGGTLTKGDGKAGFYTTGQVVKECSFIVHFDPDPSERQPTITITGSGTLVAPGQEKQEFKIHPIDASSFIDGGTITITISVGQGKSSASFDLFPSTGGIPTSGRPIGTLAGSYDIGPGSKTSLAYKFNKGQVFRFGVILPLRKFAIYFG